MNPSCKALPVAASFTISFSRRLPFRFNSIEHNRCWFGKFDRDECAGFRLFFKSQELETGLRLQRSIESNRWVLENPTGPNLLDHFIARVITVTDRHQYLLPMDRSAASSSDPRRHSTGNISSVALPGWDVKFADVMSAARFDAKEWKMILESVHQYNVVYRLLWVHRVMEQLRKEFNSRNDMINLVELLLGFEDSTWKNSEEELQYILTMDTFTTFCKRPDHETWPNLIVKGRCMDLLKDVLRFQLVNALPTIYWVDKRLDLFLLVGPQHTQEVQALFRQLTVTWNEHLRLTNSGRAPILLSDPTAHQISKETMDLAFGPVYVPGDALNVFEGILNPSTYTGLGLALLPAPIQEYLQLLWHKEVHYSNVLRQRQPMMAMSQNVLKLGLPWMSCSWCSQPKEVGTLFGLRETEANARFVPMLRLRMDDILSRIEFYRHAFHMMKVIIDLNRTLEQTPVVCCQR